MKVSLVFLLIPARYGHSEITFMFSMKKFIIIKKSCLGSKTSKNKNVNHE